VNCQKEGAHLKTYDNPRVGADEQRVNNGCSILECFSKKIDGACMGQKITANLHELSVVVLPACGNTLL